MCDSGDAMGYCAAVFAAEKLVTTNSIVRGNVCIDNGRSPKLARRQGDMYITTWNGGSLDGVRIENNTFYWNPPIDVPAFMIDQADFTGSRPNVAVGNRIYTAVSNPIHSGGALKFERNTVGPAPPSVTATSPQSGRFRLVLTGADRGQLVFLQTALVQYPKRLEALVVVAEPSRTSHMTGISAACGWFTAAASLGCTFLRPTARPSPNGPALSRRGN